MEAAASPGPERRPEPRSGWVAPRLEAELPGLGLSWVEVDAKPGRSPEPVRRRLRLLSDRVYGSQAIRLREQPVPWSYRVFFRQIGIDPDRDRTPVERRILERLEAGGFPSRGLVADALTIAIVETGVALLALDADAIEGELSLREVADGEPGMEVGTLALADDSGPLVPLFGEPGEGLAVTRRTRRVAIVATRVGSVPELSVHEALWIAAGVIENA